MNKLKSLVAALMLCGAVALAQAQALRPEVGKPLQQAYDLIKAGKGKEALAKVREAEAAPNKTAAESLQIDRMKAAAAQRAGDNATAAQALESLYGKVPAAEQGQVSLHFLNTSGAQRVAPFGGSDRRLSTNPLAIGVPGAPDGAGDEGAGTESASTRARFRFFRGRSW